MLKYSAMLAKPLAFSVQKRIKISGFTFEQTSNSYPEAYSVFDSNCNQVGYVRLRWGCLECRYPNINGERIYESFFEREHMGEFDTDELRQIFLEDVANTLIQNMVKSNFSNRQQFECVKWFSKYGFTFAEKGDRCDLIGKTKNDCWIVKTENGAVQMIDDNKFREHFETKIIVHESSVAACA